MLKEFDAQKFIHQEIVQQRRQQVKNLLNRIKQLVIKKFDDCKQEIIAHYEQSFSRVSNHQRKLTLLFDNIYFQKGHRAGKLERADWANQPKIERIVEYLIQNSGKVQDNNAVDQCNKLQHTINSSLQKYHSMISQIKKPFSKPVISESIQEMANVLISELKLLKKHLINPSAVLPIRNSFKNTEFNNFLEDSMSLERDKQGVAKKRSHKLQNMI